MYYLILLCARGGAGIDRNLCAWLFEKILVYNTTYRRLTMRARKPKEYILTSF